MWAHFLSAQWVNHIFPGLHPMVLMFQEPCSSLALYLLLNSPLSSPWKHINIMGYKWWVDLFIRGRSPGDSANLESGPFQAGQVGMKLFSVTITWLLTLDSLQMDTEAALVKAFGEVDILLTWMQNFYHLWLSVRITSYLFSTPFQAIVNTQAVLRTVQTLGHGLTPLLAQDSPQTSFSSSPNDSHGRHLGMLWWTPKVDLCIYYTFI